MRAVSLACDPVVRNASLSTTTHTSKLARVAILRLFRDTPRGVRETDIDPADGRTACENSGPPVWSRMSHPAPPRTGAPPRAACPLAFDMDLDDTSVLGTFDVQDGLPDPLPASPMALFHEWFTQAHEQKVQPNPNAMTLATADAQGRPSARIVLCKALETDGGAIVFYTNRESRKGRELSSGRAAVVFHWDVLDRQVRIEGRVTLVSDEESDAYFRTRSWERRIGAWSSRQSQPLESREQLLEQITSTIFELDIDPGALMRGDHVEIPRPPYWGGYRITIETIELWVGGTGRIHDRAVWNRPLPEDPHAQPADVWTSTRLQP